MNFISVMEIALVIVDVDILSLPKVIHSLLLPDIFLAPLSVEVDCIHASIFTLFRTIVRCTASVVVKVLVYVQRDERVPACFGLIHC